MTNPCLPSTNRIRPPGPLAALAPRLVPPALLVVAIFACSSRAHVPMPPIANFDKVVHFVLFGLLATLICRIGGGWRMALLAVAVTSAYGAMDELHQSFVPGRSCDVLDWVADTTGASLAVVIHTTWQAYRRILDVALGFGFARRAAA
jgi:VanZ family protein